MTLLYAAIDCQLRFPMTREDLQIGKVFQPIAADRNKFPDALARFP